MWTAACVLSAASALAANPESPALNASLAAPQAVVITGGAGRAESPSFVVVNQAASMDAREVARTCEQWRSRLTRFWCDCECEAWSARCQVVVYADRRSYLGAVGAGGSATYGSSLLDFGPDKKVSTRRIDIRGDSPLGLAALPHEMTHVVLADHLGGRQPPRWADEGMAILADTREKQLLHERDLNQGLASRRAFRVAELVTIDSYPDPSRVPAFYGQSASLTAFLAHRDDPAKFLEFLRRALDHGYDTALKQVYAIEHVGELESQWREQRLAWQSGYHGVRLTIDARTAERIEAMQ